MFINQNYNFLNFIFEEIINVFTEQNFSEKHFEYLNTRINKNNNVIDLDNINTKFNLANTYSKLRKNFKFQYDDSYSIPVMKYNVAGPGAAPQIKKFLYKDISNENYQGNIASRYLAFINTILILKI